MIKRADGRPYREASVVASRRIFSTFSVTKRKRSTFSTLQTDPKEEFLPKPQKKNVDNIITRKFDGVGYIYTYSNHDDEVLHIQRTKLNNEKFLASFIESESVRYNLVNGDRLRIFDVKAPTYSPIMSYKFMTNQHLTWTKASYHARNSGVNLSKGETNLSTSLAWLNLVPWMSVEVEYMYIFDTLRSLQELEKCHGKSIPIQNIPSIPDPTDLLDLSSDKYYLPYLGLNGHDPSMIVIRCDALCTLSRVYDLWLSRAACDDAAFVTTERGALIAEEKQKRHRKEKLSQTYTSQRSYKEHCEWGWVLNGCLRNIFCDKCWRCIESETK